MVEVISYLNSFKIGKHERREDVIGKMLAAGAGEGYRALTEYSLCLATDL